MTIDEWKCSFKSFINELQMPRNDYYRIMAYIDEGEKLLKKQEPIPVYENRINKCKCGEAVCRYWNPKFCGFCGKELMWY